jgi:hypothetical protein
MRDKRANSSLLLEEILEGGSRIHGPRRTRGRSFLFHPDAHGIKSTLIALVFPGDPLRNGLRAFKPTGGVEISALPAGVQFEAALRAFSDWLRYGRQQGAALRAARNRMRARHLQRPRTKGFFFDRPFRGLLFPLLAAILIPVLPILPVGHEPPPVRSAYCLASPGSLQVGPRPIPDRASLREQVRLRAQKKGLRYSPVQGKPHLNPENQQGWRTRALSHYGNMTTIVLCRQNCNSVSRVLTSDE